MVPRISSEEEDRTPIMPPFCQNRGAGNDPKTPQTLFHEKRRNKIKPKLGSTRRHAQELREKSINPRQKIRKGN